LADVSGLHRLRAVSPCKTKRLSLRLSRDVRAHIKVLQTGIFSRHGMAFLNRVR